MSTKGIHRAPRRRERGDRPRPSRPVDVERPERPVSTGSTPLPSTQALIGGVPLVLWLALASVLLRYGGAVWDVSWHLTIGRDTFWSPPHLALYTGTTLSLAAAAWALGEARRWPDRFPGRWWGIGPLRLPFGYSLALIGALIILLSAPFDDLWHFLFGRDVDIWSPPHLTAIFGGAVNVFGLAAALVPHLVTVPGRAPERARNWPVAGSTSRATVQSPVTVQRWAIVLQSVFLAHLVYTAWFSLNWFYIAAATRDVLLYPSLVGLVLLPFLVLVYPIGGGSAGEPARPGEREARGTPPDSRSSEAIVVPAGSHSRPGSDSRRGTSVGLRRAGTTHVLGNWPATTVALVFTILALLPVVFFSAIDWRSVALPPLLIVPALALDLLFQRSVRAAGKRRTLRSEIGATVVAGVVFAVLFLAVELLRMQVLLPTVPDLGSTGAQILAPYLAAVGNHPWTLPAIAAALPVVLIASVIGMTVGRLLGTVLQGEDWALED